ncbi:MAG TPA: hypothetical protein VHM64_20940, partial [Candidatus Binatia bacterium]|nr:hypothetical protein [Candidatus Binatia bacterium]
MNSRWSIYLFVGFIALGTLAATISAVTGAQSRDEEADEDALEDPLPSGVELRVFVHRPRVLKPNHLGTCTPTNTESSNFERTPWHLAGPITWSLNRKSVPASVAAGVDNVLTASFNAWYENVFIQGQDTKVGRARLDKVNAILWKKLQRSTVGLTFVWFSRISGEVLEVDTVFNKRHPWANFTGSDECQKSLDAPDAYDLQNIATHEFGHWAGRDDLFENTD